VVVTLREKSNLINPYYTWRLINKNSFDEWIISPDNNSTSNYYDAFTISIGVNFNPTSSVIIDAVQGQYDYFIYEMNTEYDLDLLNSLGLMESGILEIIGTAPSIISFTGSNDTIKVFNEL
jgi:hypothetical protein